MRELIKILIIFYAALFVGCTVYSNNHYYLMAEPASDELYQLTEAIRAQIEPIVTRLGLHDALSSDMPNGVLLYYSSGGDSALRVGVRIDDAQVILDSFQYRSGFGDSAEYSKLRKELVNALENLDGLALNEIDGPAM